MRLRGLYVIVDPEHTAGRGPVEVCRRALAGGAMAIQWRDKRRDKGEQLADLEQLLTLCRSAGAPLIVNDHVDLALAVGADGVHVGQHDLPVAVARRLLHEGAIVGCSTNNPDEARAAEAAGASYIAVGRIFPTTSKPNTRPADLGVITRVKAAVRAPIVAIGGITSENIAQVVAAGADAAAVIAAVGEAPAIEQAARALASGFTAIDT